MALFRRKRYDDAESEETPGFAHSDGDGLGDLEDAGGSDETDAAGDGPAAGAGSADVASPDVAEDGLSDRSRGPWDVSDAPEPAGELADLGTLQVPVVPGVDVRIDLPPGQDAAAAVLFTTATSAMQVSAFAAPRSAGIWREVRAEILEQLRAGGTMVSETEGPFGAELLAQLPTDRPGAVVPSRFLGINGPRWFLRALLHGRAAVEGLDAEPELASALRGIVVVRGSEAMPEREALLLRLPADAIAAARAAQEQALAQAQAEAAAAGGVPPVAGGPLAGPPGPASGT